jgi:Type II transport protein GspH
MRRASSRGASFIEVVVAVLVLGVLLLTALPRLLVPVEITAGQAARVTAADLVLARRLAIAGRANYVVTFQPAAGPFTSYSVAPQGGSPGPDFPKTFPAGVRVSGTPQVTFAPDGSAAANAALTFADGTATAQVQVLAPTGFVQETGP